MIQKVTVASLGTRMPVGNFPFPLHFPIAWFYRTIAPDNLISLIRFQTNRIESASRLLKIRRSLGACFVYTEKTRKSHAGLEHRKLSSKLTVVSRKYSERSLMFDFSNNTFLSALRNPCLTWPSITIRTVNHYDKHKGRANETPV